MTIVPLFLLTLGAINWGYAYPLVFLFVALLRQRMLGREIYFNFLYAPGFWLLLSAGMTYPDMALYLGNELRYEPECVTWLRQGVMLLSEVCRWSSLIWTKSMRIY